MQESGGLIFLSGIVMLGCFLYTYYRSSKPLDMEHVYSWCKKIEALRKELKAEGETERITEVKLESVDELMKACGICGATCVKLGLTQSIVSKHGDGGSSYVDKQKVKITF